MKPHKIFRRILPYILAFLLPALLFFVICQLQYGGIFPFGENTVITIDAEGQYIPFLAHFKSIFQTNNDMFYSFGNLLGSGIFDFVTYYLFSPFNLIFLLISDMSVAFLVVTLLKIGAAGLTAFIFLTHHFKQKPSYKTIIFSTSYAMMVYNVLFYTNTMFLDGVIMLPLIWLGIDKMLESGKSRFYVISLAAIMCFQYYMAYIVSIGAVLYFLYRFLQERTRLSDIKRDLTYVWRFIKCSVLSAILAMVVLLPTALAITTTQRSRITTSDFALSTIDYSFTDGLLDFFGNINPTYSHTSSIHNEPLMFCGVLIIALTVLFFCNRLIKRREKIFASAFIAFFLISFVFQPLDYIWHAFSIANGFLFRESFILILFLIMLSYKCFLSLRQAFTAKDTTATIGFLGILTLCNAFFLHNNLFYIILAAAAATVIALTAFYSRSPTVTTVFVGTMNIISLLVIGVICFFGTVADGAHELKNHEFFINNIEGMAKIVPNLDELEQNGLYRMEKTFQYSENDPLLFGYNGITHYSSSTRSTHTAFLSKLYFQKVERLSMANLYKNDATVSINSLFGLKYLLDLDEEDKVEIYSNAYALPIGFMADKDLLDADIDELNYFELQNKIFQSLSGIETPIFSSADFTAEYQNLREVDKDAESITYAVANSGETGKFLLNIPESDDKLYYFDTYYDRNYKIYVDQKLVETRFEVGSDIAIDPPLRLTSKYDLTENAELEIDVMRSLKIKTTPLWQESKSALGEHYAALADEPCDLNKISSSHLTCTVEAKEDGNLFFTIPNDRGWVVKVDGKKVQTQTAFDLFMAIPLTAGTHNIEMKYTPRGFWVGLFISFFAITACAIYGIRTFWRQTSLLLATCALSLKNKNYHQCFH
jgi:uncharacterized membrane protein YfhO